VRDFLSVFVYYRVSFVLDKFGAHCGVVRFGVVLHVEYAPQKPYLDFNAFLGVAVLHLHDAVELVHLDGVVGLGRVLEDVRAEVDDVVHEEGHAPVEQVVDVRQHLGPLCLALLADRYLVPLQLHDGAKVVVLPTLVGRRKYRDHLGKESVVLHLVLVLLLAVLLGFMPPHQSLQIVLIQKTASRYFAILHRTPTHFVVCEFNDITRLLLFVHIFVGFLVYGVSPQ